MPHPTTPPDSSAHPPHLLHLARQTLHNLQYQHDWTDLSLHTHSPLSSHLSTPSNTPSQSPHHTLLSRPLISGLPPQRIYIHPDQQTALLQHHKTPDKSRDGDALPEREWVLPTHIKEPWSLRRFADVFDGVEAVPPEAEREVEEEARGEAKKEVGEKRKRQKRILLATISDDSTIVYYIVHDGLVKPRQN
ncbi:MAG: hypothetical protein M1817_004815 [Caeruleum heppii]|nr:MAG: hypothetical protein M1817_004815 [Caeruleum heppii]